VDTFALLLAKVASDWNGFNGLISSMSRCERDINCRAGDHEHCIWSGAEDAARDCPPLHSFVPRTPVLGYGAGRQNQAARR